MPRYGLRYGSVPATGNFQRLRGRPPLVSLFKSCMGRSFTAVTRVQIPSGTPNLINGLEEIVLFPAGTKRHKFHPNSAALLRNHQCFRGCRAYSYRHKKAQLKTAPSAADSVCANQTDYITLRLALVKCDCLGVSVQSDAARRVPEQFLHHFDIRPRCPQQ
jgi:hypothetical protein